MHGNFYEVAINCTRGQALECAIHYGLWVHRHLSLTSKPDRQVMTELFVQLEAHLDVSKEKSKAVRAVYGRWLPWLFVLDAAWSKQNLEVILPSDDSIRLYRDAAWTAYILYCDPYDNLFKDLEPYYLQEVQRLSAQEKENLDRAETRLGEHLVSFFLRELMELSAPALEALFKKASIRLKARLMDFIGRGLSSKCNKISERIINRARAYWNVRLQACSKQSE